MWWTAADGGSVAGTVGEEGASSMHIELFPKTRGQLVCYLAVRAILALSDRVQQNSIGGA